MGDEAIYQAIAAALEHKRAAFADWQHGQGNQGTRHERWQQARDLINELREQAAALAYRQMTKPPADRDRDEGE